MHRAMTQVNLATAEKTVATHEHASDPRPHLQAALSYLENTLEIFDPESMRYNFDKAPDLKSEIEAQLAAGRRLTPE